MAVFKVRTTKRKVWKRCILLVTQAIIRIFPPFFRLAPAKNTNFSISTKNQVAASSKLAKKFKL